MTMIAHCALRCYSAVLLSVVLLMPEPATADHGGSTHTDFNLVVPATSNTGTYTVSFNAPGGAELQEKFYSGSYVADPTAVTPGKTYTGKTSGTYTYRVYWRFCYISCTDYYSAPQSIVVSSGPDVPQISGPATDYNGAFTLSWTASSGATKYQLQRRPSGGSWGNIIQDSSATTYNESGLAAGTYEYIVRACAGTTCSTYSPVHAVNVKPAPSVPAGLNAPGTDYNGAYTISWNTATGATSYRLQERLGSGSWAQIHSNSATSKAVSGRSSGTYSYRVRGCGPESVCSNWSGAISVVVKPPPAVPSGLSGPATDYNGSYTVSWNSATGATLYKLQERLGSGTWTQIHSGSATSKAVSGKSPGTYSYRVQGCGPESVCSGWSSIISVTTVPPPAAPTVLTGPTTDYNGAYTISWNSSSGATSYRLEERIGAGSWSQIYSGASTSRAISGKAAGSYSYRARACNVESACGSWSATRTVTVPPPPTTPTGLTATEPQSGSYTVSWNSSSGSSTYRLEERQGGGSWGQVYSGSSTGKAISGKEGGFAYSYRVKGCNAESVCSGWSGTYTIVVIGDTTTYEYDELGRLIRVSHPNAVITEYEYDSAGNRLSTESSIDN